MTSPMIVLAAVSAAAQALPDIYVDEGLPDLARAMLDEAAATGRPGDVEAVRAALVGVFPDYADAIDAAGARLVATLQAAVPPASDADASTAAAAPVEAGEAADPPPPTGGFFATRPWAGDARVGVAAATGNAENTSLGLGLDAKREAGPYTHNLNAFADLASAEGDQTQQRWGGAYKLDYLFSAATYAFGRLSYEEDAFSGFDYRLFAGAGLGHFLQKSDDLTIKVEAGPGYSYSPVDDTREVQREIAAYAASEIDWTIRDGVSFEQDFRINWTQPTTTFQSVTSLTTALTENIGAGLSYDFRYETSPPAGRVNTDTVFRANLTYGF